MPDIVTGDRAIAVADAQLWTSHVHRQATRVLNAEHMFDQQMDCQLLAVALRA